MPFISPTKMFILGKRTTNTPYSWNRVNLFSFGCHVIDRAYVRTGGVGETIKRKGGVSQACLAKSTSFITFAIWSIDSCQNVIGTDQYTMTILQAHVSTHQTDVIYLEAVL